VVEVAGRRAEEEEGSMGVPVPGSPGLRRWWSVGGEGSSGESSDAGSLEALKQGKEEWGRSGGRSGCRGTLLYGRRGSGAAKH
jgi:hypothetical protein